MPTDASPPACYSHLAEQIKQWGKTLGFQQIGITDTHLTQAEHHLTQWLKAGYHGEMDWMRAHGKKRSRPEALLTGTLRVISARMNYRPPDTEPIRVLKNPDKAYIARYALGRDYHKVMRKRLGKLAHRLEQAVGDTPLSQRAFVDSAPVMEKPLGEKAGLGWIGKNTLLINSQAGSWFFLGEIYTNLPLPIDRPAEINQCGSCTACLKICPTDAFVAPYQLDARRCIAYLTIEHKGPIPLEFREPMGNRVFGCDDCQAICPWNKHSTPTLEADFAPRHRLDNANLLDLFLWDEEKFIQATQGSAIRRAGYEGWLRNLAVGLGNAPSSAAIIRALQQRRADASPMVQEHIDWALVQQLTPKRRRKRKVRQ